MTLGEIRWAGHVEVMAEMFNAEAIYVWKTGRKQLSWEMKKNGRIKLKRTLKKEFIMCGLAVMAGSCEYSGETYGFT
jgi:hypothetical protein